MQHGTVFGTVDLLTGEHGLDSPCQIGLFRQILQFRQRLFRDAVFGEIHQHLVVEGCGEFAKTVAVFREQIRDGDVFHFVEVFL
ncbi:hypothetical protein D3C78_758560 [compost metagenome]